VKYLVGEDFAKDSRYGVVAREINGSANSCFILASGECPSIHDKSAVIFARKLFLAIGNRVCCLDLPSLALEWQKRVDVASCFGLYLSPDKAGVISHGETDIVKLSFGGAIEWSVSGNDVFSEKFILLPDHVEAIDFNHQKYTIAISDGEISEINGG